VRIRKRVHYRQSENTIKIFINLKRSIKPIKELKLTKRNYIYSIFKK